MARRLLCCRAQPLVSCITQMCGMSPSFGCQMWRVPSSLSAEKFTRLRILVNKIIAFNSKITAFWGENLGLTIRGLLFSKYCGFPTLKKQTSQVLGKLEKKLSFSHKAKRMLKVYIPVEKYCIKVKKLNHFLVLMHQFSSLT